VDIAQHRRIACWIERGVLLLSLCYVCLHVMPRAWSGLVTDFPNYYMSARLAHEHDDTSRMYEWTWLQREKDQHAVDIRVIGLVPITPFSTLAIWPLMGFASLTAKHIWILLNLLLLVPIGWMLRSITRLNYQQIALAFSLSIPLYRNLEFGQFYVLLLLLIVAAVWAYLRGYRALAGVLVALAAALKIFPAIFFVFFLQRRDWRALAWGAITSVAAACVSVAVFGWNVHRTYLHEILPWALHGGGLQPYQAGASISGVLHYLFLSEPQWNPHPWHSSPLCYALLLPALQMLVLAPAIILIRREDTTRGRILLEWSALLTASLADLRADAASYNFVLIAFPLCVLTAVLLQRKRYAWLAALLIAYLGIGFPLPIPHRMMGPAILLHLPRLPLMFALLLGIYVLLWHDRPFTGAARDWTRYAWAAAMAISVILSTRSTFLQERAVRREYAYRLPLQTQGFLNADPQSSGTSVRYIAFTLSGYHLVTADKNMVSVDPPEGSPTDDLSFTSGFGHVWAEQGLSPHSQIIDTQNPSHVVINDAREPMLSSDGQSLAFIRDDHGRGRLMVQAAFQSNATNEVALTPSSLNVYEASFVSGKRYAFAAVEGQHPPQIFLTDATHLNTPLMLGESRYPALSPDGRWMAYSHFESGAWNLWIRDQATGATRRIVDEPCNQIQPSWENDSKTLLYSTDCGRSLWFTAISRRRVIP
jgi:Glycosyltransferase family 87/WD40-like Beta Propeller Repeat